MTLFFGEITHPENPDEVQGVEISAPDLGAALVQLTAFLAGFALGGGAASEISRISRTKTRGITYKRLW